MVKEKPKLPKWHPEFDEKFQKKVKDIKKKRESGEKPNATAGWKIPLDFMLPLVMKCWLKGDKEIYFSLANAMEPQDCEGQHLFVMGYNDEGQKSWAEDLPPIIDPPGGGG